MKHNSLRLRKFAGIALWTLLFSSVCLASQWTKPATELAGNIADISGPGTAHLSYRNASSLSATEFRDFTHELESALRGRGLRLVTGNAAVEVAVTASESARGYVLVAEVQQGANVRAAVVLAPRMASAPASGGGAVVTLHKALLVEQDEPILDALLLDPSGPNAQLVVLDTGRITLSKRSADQWQSQASFEISHAHPWPLDARGRLMPAADHAFEAYLPGVVCSSTNTAPLAMSCRAADDPWPIGEKQSAFFNSSRNYFNGVISPGVGSQTNVEPFFSAVALPRPGYTLWMFSGVDGRVRMADGKDVTTLRPNSAARDWGSDLALVNGCGRGPLILASGTGDATTPDSVRAYEMPDREPIAVSAGLDFPGPVTALWSQSDGKSATAVVHTLSTGKYDAYSISVTCNQ